MNADEDNSQEAQLPAQVVSDFVENQKRELEIRALEVHLKQQADQNSFVHAGKVLEAQERDRADTRRYKLSAAKQRFVFIVATVIVATLFVGCLAWLGKDQLALEIVRAIVYLSAGGIGGFFYGRHKARQDVADEPDPDYTDP